MKEYQQLINNQLLNQSDIIKLLSSINIQLICLALDSKIETDMKNKVSKKEIKTKVSEVLSNALNQMDIAKPSRKTKKLIRKVTKKLSGEVAKNLNKNTVVPKTLKKKKVKKESEVQPG